MARSSISSFSQLDQFEMTVESGLLISPAHLSTMFRDSLVGYKAAGAAHLNRSDHEVGTSIHHRDFSKPN